MTNLTKTGDDLKALTDLLGFVGLFDGLTARQLGKLAARLIPHELKADEVLFRQGDPAHAIYIIQNGFVDIRVNRQTVGILGQGQSIGEMAWLDGGARSATVRSLTDTRIPFIPFHTMTSVIKKNSGIGYIIMRNLASDLSFRLRQRSKAMGK